MIVVAPNARWWVGREDGRAMPVATVVPTHKRLMPRAGFSLPAIRGHQGGRSMYLVLPTLRVVNNTMSPEMEPDVERSQRVFDPAHARGVTQYLVDNPSEYVLGALQYAVDTAGEFEELVEGSDLGVLHLPLDATLRSIDGMHRRRALPEALSQDPALGDDQLAVLIYVEPELEKRKQMFSDINWNQRAVPKSVNVGFNVRDPFALAVNNFLAARPEFDARVERQKPSVRRGTDKLFTLGALYDALRRYTVGAEGRVRDPGKYQAEWLKDRAEELFGFVFARPEIVEVLKDPSVTEEKRQESILLNGTTLKMIAAALYTVLAKQKTASMANLAPKFMKIDFSPAAETWQRSGFIAPGKTTPSARNQEVRAAMNELVTALTA